MDSSGQEHIADHTVMEYIKGIKIFKAHNMTSTHFERLLESLEKVRKISVQIECQMAPPTAIYSILVNFLMPLVLLGGSYLLLGGQIPNESFIAFLIMSMAISGLLISFEHYYIMLPHWKPALLIRMNTFPNSWTPSTQMAHKL